MRSGGWTALAQVAYDLGREDGMGAERAIPPAATVVLERVLAAEAVR